MIGDFRINHWMWLRGHEQLELCHLRRQALHGRQRVAAPLLRGHDGKHAVLPTAVDPDAGDDAACDE
jgi:hypothetical protein